MDFLDLVRRRESVRRYLHRPVEREKIERCLEAARLAPSACNAQPWRFIVVDEPELKDAVANETFGPLIRFNRFVPQAPVLVVVVSEQTKLMPRVGGRIKNKSYHLIDVGIAAGHFCLQAVEEGLGTCMLGWFNEKRIKELLGIPRQNGVELVIALGYPAEGGPRPKQRRDIEQIRYFNRYTRP